MAKKVMCLYCTQQFDREHVEYTKVGRRYAHLACYEKEYEKKQAETADHRKLTDLIQSLYYPQEPDWGMIGSQLKRYKDEGMTYMGMYYTLTYFFVIQQNDIKTGKGVGIIPYAYNKAKAYYKNLDNTYAKAAEIENKKSLDVNQTESIVTVIQKKPKKRLIDFNYDE